MLKARAVFNACAGISLLVLLMLSLGAIPAQSQIVGIASPSTNDPSIYVLFKDGALWSGRPDAYDWKEIGHIGSPAVGLAAAVGGTHHVFGLTRGGGL